ncbi:hypothetical protein TSUD_60280 [Trifolium subterraneum]|uniref:Uncharacterized protein n=1 Tax=Trifolium subterraneum TaxID=3900 RepID=A0A2Z6N7M0_TRISU|nr:hypothetical protein TSUD_60280 [Trifolium subterraneum]
MHQYHIGNDEEEKEGVLVVSKVFYQTQPRQCGGGNSLMKDSKTMKGQSGNEVMNGKTNGSFVEYYHSNLISFDQGNQNRSSNFEGGSFIP